jgi:hypothetical protein
MKERPMNEDNVMEQNASKLIEGLQALSDSAFPKHCAVCGKRFDTVEQFVKETENMRQKSGLRTSRDDDDHTIVEMFRNCPCGSTLMSSFADRRDTSSDGLRRRELFEQLMTILTKRGVETNRARAELLKFIKEGASPLLEKLGLKQHR